MVLGQVPLETDSVICAQIYERLWKCDGSTAGQRKKLDCDDVTEASANPLWSSGMEMAFESCILSRVKGWVFKMSHGPVIDYQLIPRRGSSIWLRSVISTFSEGSRMSSSVLKGESR